MKKVITICLLLLLSVFANGQSWQPLGPIDSLQVSNKQASFTSIAIDNMDVPFIAFTDGGDTSKVHVRKYNGSSWVDVGLGFSSNNASYVVMAMSAGGTPYVAYRDAANGNKATVKKYNGTTWVVVGIAGFSAGAATDLSMAIDTSNGTPYVVYQDGGNANKATVKKYNGTSWVDVGTPGISIGIASTARIAIERSGIPYIVYSDAGASSKAIVKKFDGTSWVTVGTTGPSVSSVSSTAIAIDANGVPYVVYADNIASGKDSVKKYNGINWVAVAGSTGLSAGTASANSIIVVGNNPYVTYTDGGTLYFKKYDGTNWVLVGATLATAYPNHPTIAFNSNNIPYIAFADINNASRASVKKFDGTNWVPLYTTGIATSAADNPSVAIDTAGIPFTAYEDVTNASKLSVSKYDGSNWTPVGTPGFSSSALSTPASIVISKANIPYVVYQDSGNITVKKYDGTNWLTIGTAGFGIGGANYVSMAIDTGGVPYAFYQELGTNYDQLAAVKKYNGTAWVNVGASGISTGAATYNAIAIAPNNIPYIIYQSRDANYNDIGISVKKYDGANWVDVGPAGISSPMTSYSTIAINNMGIPYIAYQEINSVNYTYQIKVKQYNGTNWIDIGGNVFSAGHTAAKPVSLVIGKNNILYISYSDDSNGKKVAVKQYENNTWSPVGTAVISDVEAIYPSLAINQHKLVSAYQIGIGYGMAGTFAKQYIFPVPCDTALGLVLSNRTSNSATYTWSSVASAVGYEYVLDQSAATPATAGTTISTNSYAATALAPNTTYYFHLRTNCSANNFSSWITRKFKTFPVCDTSPNLVVSNIAVDSAYASWSVVTGAVGYEYIIDQTTATPSVAGTSTLNNTYNATGLTANTTYYIHLRTDCGSGNYSAWITRAFTTLRICDTVLGLAISNITTTTADVNWNSVTGALNYEYVLDQNSANPMGLGTPNPPNSYSAMSLSPNTKYYFHLRTDCGNNNYSPWIMTSFTSMPVGVHVLTSDVFNLKVYPNPVTDILSIHIDGDISHAILKLTEVTGKTVKILHIDYAKDVQINMQGIMPGTYWLKYADDVRTKIINVQKL